MEPTSTNAIPLPRLPFMIYILLWINIIVFVMLISYDGLSLQNLIVGPKIETLIFFGAKQNGLIADLQLERLLIPMFMHANLMHLGFNMYAFIQVGKFLEIVTGPYILLALYIFAGLLGNVFSFAFIPSWSHSAGFFGSSSNYAMLSVGASGSLFGILLFLFVLQKYQERFLSAVEQIMPKINLGPLIVINGVITFAIPRIDWACHLGGAIAGALLGVSFCFYHARHKKYYEAVKYFSFSQKIPQVKWYKHEYFFITAVIVLIFAGLSKIFFIDKQEIVIGRGLYLAAHEKIEEHNLEYLSRFNNIILGENSVVNPLRLQEVAFALHREKKFSSALLVYLVLNELYEAKVGGNDFLTHENRTVLSLALVAAEKQVALPLEIPHGNEEAIKITSDICSAPAEIFRELGFFILSGALYECSYNLDVGNLALASKTIEQYWRAQHKTLLERFLNLLEQTSVDKIGISKDMNDAGVSGSPTPDPVLTPTQTPILEEDFQI